MLRLELTKEEVLPLLHSLIDGLTDEVVTSAKGASLVLCSLLETRGFEEDVAGIILHHHQTLYIKKFLAWKHFDYTQQRISYCVVMDRGFKKCGILGICL